MSQREPKLSTKEQPLIVDGQICHHFVTEEVVGPDGVVTIVKKPHPVYSEIKQIKQILNSFDLTE